MAVYQLPMLENFQWMADYPEADRPALFERGLELLNRDLQHGPRRRTLPGHNLLSMNTVPKLELTLTPRAAELIDKIKKMTLEDELLTGVRAIMMVMRAGVPEAPKA